MAGQLTDDAGQAGMAQPLLHALQHGHGLAGLGIDDAIRLQPGRIEGGGKQIGPFQHPQHRPGAAAENARDQQRRSGAMLDIRPAARHFMQGAQGEAAAR